MNFTSRRFPIHGQNPTIRTPAAPVPAPPKLQQPLPGILLLPLEDAQIQQIEQQLHALVLEEQTPPVTSDIDNSQHELDILQESHRDQDDDIIARCCGMGPTSCAAAMSLAGTFFGVTFYVANQAIATST
ncbi:hypothetical protein BGZ54_004068 [Gamsiella multidivaricata]|nr:hypothetical protein BGZ54_004068 [Gamsiella multidivaricata]